MITFINRAARATHKWATLLIALTVTTTGLLQVTNIKPVFASYTNTYPWGSAPCAESGSNLGKTSGTGYWCTDYNWGESPCPSGDGFCTSGWLMNGYYLLDQYGEGFRNCVSYTAWQLDQVFGLDITTKNSSGWGNGADWNTNALAAGYTDDSSPQVGDIAQWNSPAPWGHVAYVYNVVGSTAYYAEFNHLQDGTYQDTETSATQGTPDHWIHIGTVSSGTLWGINTSGQAVRYAGGGVWTNQGAPTAFQRIANDSSGATVAAVSTTGGVYTYTGNNTWHQVSGATLIDIADSNGTLWGINTSGQAVRYAGNGVWTNQGAPTTMTDIAASTSTQVAISTTGGVYSYTGNNTWHQVSGASLIDVAMENGTLWGINTSGQAVRYAGGGVWTNQGGVTFTAIGANDSSVVAVSTAGGVYTYTGNNTWHQVSGATLIDVTMQ